jgi:lysozyme
VTVAAYETGPDLSHWQGGAVDFPAIKRAGHAFVILKATEGVGGEDPEFAANRARARAGSLYIGLYHFARAGSPTAEADHFADVVGTVGAREWIVTDEEVYSADPPAWVGAFDDRARERLGVVPVSYLNQSARDRWNWSPVVARGSELWLAKYDGVYSDSPGGSGAWPRVAMEQYTDKGICPGVSAPCDMNVFYGAAADLPALSRPGPTPVPIPLPSPRSKEVDMLLIRNSKGTVALLADTWAESVNLGTDNAALQKNLGAPVPLSDDLFDRVIARARAAGTPPVAPAPAAAKA